jgi:hypothetical protein
MHIFYLVAKMDQSNRSNVVTYLYCTTFLAQHMTLPRHFPGEISGGSAPKRADPGTQEEKELYKFWATTQAHIVEFGIGGGFVIG